MPSLHNHQTTGQSFLEVLVVFAITAIVGATAALSLQALTAKRALQKDLQAVVSTLEQTSLCAAEFSHDMTVQINPGRLDRISDLGPPCEGNSFAFSPNTKIEAETLPLVVSFYSSGVVSPASLRLKDRGQSCAIRVSLRGRVTWSCP